MENKNDEYYIKNMLDMQRRLDDKVEEVHNCTIGIKNLEMALLDEIGELTHELKYTWCWWKKTQAPVDKESVLEELIDVLHFALSYENQYGLSTHVTYEEQIQFEKKHISVYGLASVLADLIERGDGLVERTIAIGESLSFTIEEMFEEYKKKNKINYQRLKEGY